MRWPLAHKQTMKLFLFSIYLSRRFCFNGFFSLPPTVLVRTYSECVCVSVRALGRQQIKSKAMRYHCYLAFSSIHLLISFISFGCAILVRAHRAPSTQSKSAVWLQMDRWADKMKSKPKMRKWIQAHEAHEQTDREGARGTGAKRTTLIFSVALFIHKSTLSLFFRVAKRLARDTLSTMTSVSFRHLMNILTENVEVVVVELMFNLHDARHCECSATIALNPLRIL